MEEASIVVIGAGVEGLSVAASLSEACNDILVLEKNRKPGQEISTHNSGVIHSGIHYPEGSLKARLCVEGNSMIYDLCEKNGISHRKLGKLTVATDRIKAKQLSILLRNGTANGVRGLKILDRNEISEFEPGVSAEAALFSPTSGIIEPDELMNHYISIMRKNGAIISTESRVNEIRKSEAGYILSGTSGNEKFEINARTVINCAGLFADSVAEMAGMDIDSIGYRQRYCKGDYFRINGTPPVRMLVYPVPEESGLGIHLTPDMAGSVKLGPNAYYVDSVDYNVQSSAEEFRNDVGKFLPSISEREISVDSSGIRPRLTGPGTFRDFIIRHEADIGYPGFVNLIGIESPGLTASPAIGRYVSEIYSREILH